MADQNKNQPSNSESAPRVTETPDPRRPKAPEPKTFRSRTGEVPNYSDKWATGRYESAPEKTTSQEDNPSN